MCNKGGVCVYNDTPITLTSERDNHSSVGKIVKMVKLVSIIALGN